MEERLSKEERALVLKVKRILQVDDAEFNEEELDVVARKMMENATKSVPIFVGELTKLMFLGGLSLPRFLLFIDLVILNSEARVHKAFAANEDFVDKLVTVVSLWCTKEKHRLGDGRKEQPKLSKKVKIIWPMIDHDSYDQVIFLLCGLAGTRVGIAALVLTLHAGSSLTPLFHAIGSTLCHERDFTTQEQSLELLCRLFRATIAFLGQDKEDRRRDKLLSTLPSEVQQVLLHDNIGKMLAAIRPSLTKLNKYNPSIDSFKLESMDYIVNWVHEEHSVRLRGCDWLDVGADKVQVGFPDCWVSFAIEDIRRVHVEDTENPHHGDVLSMVISLERMPRNLESPLLVAGAPERPDESTVPPALRFFFATDKMGRDVKLGERLQAVFESRLRKLEQINLHSHRKTSLPSATLDRAPTELTAMALEAKGQEKASSPLRTPATVGPAAKAHVSKISARTSPTTPAPPAEHSPSARSSFSVGTGGSPKGRGAAAIMRKQAASTTSRPLTDYPQRAFKGAWDETSNASHELQPKFESQVGTIAEPEPEPEPEPELEPVIEHTASSRKRRSRGKTDQESSLLTADASVSRYPAKTPVALARLDTSMDISMGDMGGPPSPTGGNDDEDRGDNDMMGVIMAQLMASQ